MFTNCFYLIQIPTTSVTGDYKLKVEGLFDGVIGGYAFTNETRLNFSQRSMTIFIQTDKPIYKQSDIGKSIFVMDMSYVQELVKNVGGVFFNTNKTLCPTL